MRHACLAIFLSLFTTMLAALEIEDHRFFPGTGERVLKVISTADLEVFAPYLAAFQSSQPGLSIDYTVVSSAELYRAIRNGAAFDLALSSAMDLQFQLANDGFAKSHRSEATTALPDWARWRDLIFAFTAEPAVVVLSTQRFQGLYLPTTRQELVTLLREYPERFEGSVGTYDVRDSGLGYLFATQEARSTDAYWRLSEVMGRLNPQLYCCSGQMIDDVAEGRLALAYNVLGSYAAERLARDSGGRVQILGMQDFTNVILRTAIIPEGAQETAGAGALIDMLARLGQRDVPGDWPLPPLGQTGADNVVDFGPIRLGPALMVYLDPLNRRAFLTEWENALEQR
ncbi:MULTISPECIES: ABC transporter substrate-binding protein [Marivita]|uniref:ABC transporter substrate-binding protein n=1 Tax=Marivita cryptomonadis TaxID=505252 RepID=A0A9Q2P015_9RHOB|nr:MULTISPECIES: extracellular solute-binding protein [Marivita]MCR9169263.1 extracellular solute-binding protein [Paracoccaceae bacterium]MBM2324004.1 ABC transporter substrate-binding protein [Marivita cryptomonadis]MBM2333593.1 ABC transporter substrate-binding protein [Marivita cryptomonadis]MBM2343171.1 ABC transporter substrate-binding protein [Marivita cryptomonadis]MBM2347842.1 ABC transporter substrate-binding protein [Marivita cryptomonadis]